MTALANVLKHGIDHMPDAPILALEDVSVTYASGTRALRDVSFSLAAGERVAVVGPNGAGKSTLFKLIVGEIRPNRGQIRIFGSDPRQHVCIAYVPQRNQIDWSFPVTVEDVVMMGRVRQIGLFRWPRRSDWALVQACLARVGAEHLARKQIGDLSGGQQQRVFIARALAQETELLLLDEPLSGLDIPSQQAIFAILDALAADGVTTIMATHDLNLAAERFDRIMLLNQRIIAFDRPDRVLTAEHLLAGYGGHVHTVSAESGDLIIADSCCGDG